MFSSLYTRLQTFRLDRLTRLVRQLQREEEGANLVLISLMLMVLLGFAGLAIDGSNVYFQQQRMQIAADAAALGGARQLALNADYDTVDATIRELAFANYADRVEWHLINNDRGVHVTAFRTVEAFFAQLYGYDTFTVSAEAEAQYEPVTGTDNLFPLTLDCDCINEENPMPVHDGGGDPSYDDNPSNDPGAYPGEEELPPPCELYPIALSAQTLAGVNPGDVVTDIFNGVQPGNFGWLSWDESNDTPSLIASLTPPGDSHIYTNPYDPNDHVISIGDWVSGRPGVMNASGVRAALDTLKTQQITVPVWDLAQGSGSNAEYRVVQFARVRLLDYQLPNQNRITARFIGYDQCVGNLDERATIGFDEGSQSQYEITFLSHVGNHWSYQVRKLSGNNLSHWSLGIDTCLDKVVSSDPSGAELGVDGSTGFNGIKWTIGGDFDIGVFSFTLDGDYPSGVVEAQVKVGSQAGTTPIRGPICDGTNGGGDDGGTPIDGICLPAIDFEVDDAGASLVAGQVVDNEFASWGVHVTTLSPINHPAMIFDSANPTGNDPDLGSPHQDFGGPGKGMGGAASAPGRNSAPLGKVLIVAETNNPSNPDDAANGGTVVMTFDFPVRIDEVHILDIDDASAAGTVKAYSDVGGGNLIATGHMAGLGDNSFQIVPVDAANAMRLEINLPKGGAVPAVISCRSQQLPRYRIGNLIWADTNSNGLQDSGESGIAGVELELYAAGQSYLIARTTTNAGGEYTFGNLPAGTYEVKIADANFASGGVLAGTLYSPRDSGADDKDSDFNSATGKATATVPLNGGDNFTIDGGFSQTQLAEPGPDSGVVTLNDNKNSRYEIALVERTETSWTYRVKELSGRDLSHWDLGIANCLDHIVSVSPTSGYEAGTDGSTGFVGVKWNVGDSFSQGYFTINLDGNYAKGKVKALAKGGPKNAQIDIAGPDCSLPDTGDDPGGELGGDPDGDPGGDSGGDPGGDSGEPAACSFGWLDWSGGPTSNMELKEYMDNTSRSGKWNIGDVVPAGPALSGSILVMEGLEPHINNPIKIPLSEFNGTGYAICGFVEVRLNDYDFREGQRWLSVEFLKSLIRGDNDPAAEDFGGRDVEILK